MKYMLMEQWGAEENVVSPRRCGADVRVMTPRGRLKKAFALVLIDDRFERVHGPFANSKWIRVGETPTFVRGGFARDSEQRLWPR